MYLQNALQSLTYASINQKWLSICSQKISSGRARLMEF